LRYRQFKKSYRGGRKPAAGCKQIIDLNNENVLYSINYYKNKGQE